MKRLLQRLQPSSDRPADLSARRSRPVLQQDPDLIYAIGDVHGCLDALIRIERAILEDSADRSGLKMVVMLGDYVDRGPESAGVLDHMAKGPPIGFRRVCLAGNHDEGFLKIFREPSSLHSWLDFGGSRTLQSYGIDFAQLQQALRRGTGWAVEFIRSVVPPEHLLGLSRLPISLTTPSFFFAHAGARPGVALSEQSDRDLMWIRTEFLQAPQGTFDRRIVHGHTPASEPFEDAVRIGVDTGAFSGGYLTAARLTRDGVKFLCVRN